MAWLRSPILMAFIARMQSIPSRGVHAVPQNPEESGYRLEEPESRSFCRGDLPRVQDLLVRSVPRRATCSPIVFYNFANSFKG